MENFVIEIKVFYAVSHGIPSQQVQVKGLFSWAKLEKLMVIFWIIVIEKKWVSSSITIIHPQTSELDFFI